MNSLKKGERVPLLNFVGGAGVPLLNFEGSPGISLLNFRGVPGPTFKLWRGSQGPEVLDPGVLVPLLRHACKVHPSPYVTWERGNNKIHLQAKFIAFTSLRKKITCLFRKNMILIQIIIRKIIPKNVDLFKVICN